MANTIKYNFYLDNEVITYLDKQVIKEGYVSRAEYIRHLIREDMAKSRRSPETSEGCTIDTRSSS